MSFKPDGKDTVHGVLVQRVVALELNQDHEDASIPILLVAAGVLVQIRRQEHVEEPSFLPDGEHMDHGVLVL